MAAAMRDLSQLNTVPNLISLSRLAMGPVAMALILQKSQSAALVALVIMMLAELSDFVDGIIARRFNQDSEIGKLVDPVCDSVYHLFVFIAFLANDWMPIWMLFVIYARDLAVPYLQTFVRQSGASLGPRPSGKLKTAVHAVAQIGVVAAVVGLLPAGLPAGVDTATALLLLATLASLVSLVDYAVTARRKTGIQL